MDMGTRLWTSGSSFTVAPAPTQGSHVVWKKGAQDCRSLSHHLQWKVSTLTLENRFGGLFLNPKGLVFSLSKQYIIYSNWQFLLQGIPRSDRPRRADRSDLSLDREVGGWDKNRGRGSLQSSGACLRSAWSSLRLGVPTSLHRHKRTTEEPALFSLKQDKSLHFFPCDRNY